MSIDFCKVYKSEGHWTVLVIWLALKQSAWSYQHLFFEPAARMSLELVEVTWEELLDKAQHPNCVCVGATVDIHCRKREHEREGYTGTMYYTATKKHEER